MKEIKIDELKQIQIEILDYVDNFCKKNKIKYWIDCGTLLGAVRHKGFIPWDDDIDIGMLREDYEKFMQLFNKDNKSKYYFICYETAKNCPYTFGKILDTSTLMYEPNKESGIESSVFIDLIPYDNVPDNENKMNKMFKKRDFYKKLNNLQKYKEFYIKNKNKFKFIRYPFHLLMKLFPDGYFVKKNIKLCKSLRNMDTKNVGNLTGWAKQFCDKSIFDSFVELEFESKKYPAPIGYDKWLRSFYGDYMKLPPKEKQISHHRFEAYFKDKDEK